MPSATTIASSSRHITTIPDTSLNSRESVGQPGDQLAIELDDPRVQIGDVLEVRVAGAEIVDDEVDAAAAHLGQDRLAQVEVRERHALGDLEVDVAVVLEERVAGLDDPAAR